MDRRIRRDIRRYACGLQASPRRSANPPLQGSIRPFRTQKSLPNIAIMAFAGTISAVVSLSGLIPFTAHSAEAVAAVTPANKEIPAPVRLKEEAAHVAALDKALAPVRDYAPSAEDAKRIKEAVSAVAKANMVRFIELKAEITDPVALKLLDWVRLRYGYGDPAEYRAFLKANPLWPQRSLLTQRMEEQLFSQGGSAASIKQFFQDAPPETGLGYAALASAYLAEGNKEEARKLAAKTWREYDIPSTLETGFLERFSGLLTEQDHKWRFDRMVTDDVRWAGNRKARSAYAKRVIPLLSEPERKKAIARLAVFDQASNARKLMAALPSDPKDTGLAYHRAQLLRKADKTDEAAKIIMSFRPDPEKIPEIDEWWAERRQLAYDALKENKYQLAYQLTRDAGPLSVNPLKEQTFMAGWIAFRYLGKPDVAAKHFADMAKAADGPLSRAKATYWQGRVAEALGDSAGARAFYKAGAKDSDTFHGLLCIKKLDPTSTRIEITPPKQPTAEQIARFNNLDAVKAVVLADKAGLSRNYTRGFLTSLRIGLPTEEEAGMIAYLADAIGDTQMSLRVAKSAIARGQNLITYGYPVHVFPAYTPLRQPPELPFLLGIARQETEFDTSIVSGAGAKGLLQVMTVTAKHVCRDYKLKCDISRLLKDPSYNAMIASAYIGDRMDEFDGSYVLGLAGYNAGPGRARQWVREFGDPRDPKIDPIDWIERIPIRETREYVAKVLSNIQIYRARIGNEATALQIDKDLQRARGSGKIPTKTDDRENRDGDGAGSGSEG
ncbi:MAG: transglycosylase SLT domain-containing protein [Hyphomicrobiaceae bacterium]